MMQREEFLNGLREANYFKSMTVLQGYIFFPWGTRCDLSRFLEKCVNEIEDLLNVLKLVPHITTLQKHLNYPFS